MATLHFMSGLAGSGKTTIARRLAAEMSAIVICEDEWLARLAEPINNLQQYLNAAIKIRGVIAPLSIELLTLGISVVFDFAGNTARDRAWVRSIFESAATDHVLHFLRADDASCKARVRGRNSLQPPGIFFGIVTDQQLDEVNRFFEPPEDNEGFTILIHEAGAL